MQLPCFPVPLGWKYGSRRATANRLSFSWSFALDVFPRPLVPLSLP